MGANMQRHKTLESFVFEISHLVATLSTVHGFSRDDDLILAVFITGLDARFGTLATILTANETITFDTAVKLVKDFAATHPVLQSLPIQDANKLPVDKSFVAKKPTGCYNCTGPHHEKICKSPCKICRSKEHTRYGCPNKNKPEFRNSWQSASKTSDYADTGKKDVASSMMMRGVEPNRVFVKFQDID
eukprot:gb/GEZN01002909.1/.p2 GENE.gb/GEZN01002909.1/~~gb/GEZN01002909.1/.p2  ORF type:complete len:188 (+),score=24.78 gb/GEZN01002909.1/:1556-2119(+)